MRALTAARTCARRARGYLVQLHWAWWERAYGPKGSDTHPPDLAPVCKIACEAVGGKIGCSCIENPAGGRYVGPTADPGSEED